jgi:MarR family transcriptional regulator, organic hydroperoxide resistance regulator
MNDSSLIEQAKAISALLPAVMRELFSLDGQMATDLPIAQLRVCGLLYAGPQRMSDLGRELEVSLSSMTQIADRLERAGLVERVSDESDRRIRCLQLTARGAEMMRRHQESHVQSVMDALKTIPPDEQAEIQRALERLLEAGRAVKAQQSTEKESPVRGRALAAAAANGSH